MAAILSQPPCVSSLLPSDTIWWHKSGSSLAQVMACYLNQCWLGIIEGLWHSFGCNFTRNVQYIYHWHEFENYQFKATATFPMDQWVNYWPPDWEDYWGLWCVGVLIAKTSTIHWFQWKLAEQLIHHHMWYKDEAEMLKMHGVYSALKLLKPWCPSTWPSVSTWWIQYSLYWTGVVLDRKKINTGYRLSIVRI